MCGLVGAIAWDEKHRVSREQLARMSARIAHRGPDGEGIWTNDAPEAPKAACGFAHRRLAILDPDPRANQPFTDHRGRHLVYNGEIYNFRELRTELTRLRPDYHWRTTCDTEVLLVAYDVLGERCVEHFDGMFAFAIWDEPAQSLLLARDRMGQKPLYLAVAPGVSSKIGVIAFASELSALRALPWVDTTTDDAALSHYLRWGYIPAPLTIYRGCEKLPPGRWMRVTAQKVEIKQYFDPNDSEKSPTGDVRTLVSDAVRRQLVSDVPLGCFLSGGIDSSIIAAAMKAAVGPGQPVLTFAIGFDDPRYDETRHAAEVARYLGTKHQQFIVRPDAAADLPRLAEVFGEPFADSSALPTHYLARETRKHVKVALSGDGGDELFGGYDRYRATWMANAFQALPEALRRVATKKIIELAPGGKDPKSAMARVKRMLATMNLPSPQRYDSYMRYFSDEQLSLLYPCGEAGAPAQWLVQRYTALSAGRDLVQTAMALDRETYLPEDLLTKVDRASMLHALEVRSPFMDPALVRFASGLTTEQLFGVGSTAKAFMQNPMNTPAKYMLRQAFARDLPASVFKRPKMGFAVPIGEWFRGGLREMLTNSLTSATSFASTHFDARGVRELIDDHQQGRADHSQRLYALLMLELWRQCSG